MVEVNRHYERHQPPCVWHISAKRISSDVIQFSHRRKLIISAAQEDYCRTTCPPVDKFNRSSCVCKDFLLRRIRYQSSKRGQASDGNMGGRTAQALFKKKKNTHTTLVSERKKSLCALEKPPCGSCPPIVTDPQPRFYKRRTLQTNVRLLEEGHLVVKGLRMYRTSNLSATSCPEHNGTKTDWKHAARDVGSTDPPAWAERQFQSSLNKNMALVITGPK